MPLLIQEPPVPLPPAPPNPSASAPAQAPQQFLPPTNRAELDALRRTREELSEQIQSAARRRDQIAAEIPGADPSARAGLEQRLAVLDARIVQLEADIAFTGRLLTSPEATSAQTVPGDRPFGPLDADQITGISIVFVIFVLFPLALAMARLMWKRATSPRAPRSTVDSERLERVEHAVETIAIEVERVSEGQRFVTKLLAQPNGLPLPSAPRQGEPIAARVTGDPSEPR